MTFDIGTAVVRRRALVLLTALTFTVLAGAFGSGAIPRLKGGGLDDPASESARATALLAERFQTGAHNLVLLATAPAAGPGAAPRPVDAADTREAGLALTTRLAAEPGVTGVVSYWSTGAAGLRSGDGRQALVLARVQGDEDQAVKRAEALLEDYVGSAGPLDVTATGTLVIQQELEKTIKDDLTRAEMVAIPITMLLLVAIFGTVVAAALPLVIGALATVGTLAILNVLSRLTDVSVFALNLTTALALGLGIDYSLLVVSRFREELASGVPPHEAAVRCVRAAGRTIAFSAATVAAALSALLVFPQYFFRSFAYAGVAVTLLAAVGASIVLPALLAVLGHRVEALPVRRRQELGRHARGRWQIFAEGVMRRPVAVALAVTSVLVLMGLPFLRVEFGLPDDRVLPNGAAARHVSDQIREGFPGRDPGALQVVTRAADHDLASQEGARYAAALSSLPGVARVDLGSAVYVAGEQLSPADRATQAQPTGGSPAWLSVVPAVEPLSSEGEELAERVRSTPSPVPVLVTGQSAALVDAKASMAAHLPLALAVVVTTTLVLLFFLLGSVLLPVKAVVLNTLSLTALYGSMVWIFQDGHLSGLLGFTATGQINLAMPVLMFCLAFGLSMDYEVFLMSRIREEHQRWGDNAAAVGRGLQRTGGVVTAAALVMSVVFLSFATSGVALIKLFGLGVTLAVLMDAAVIRPTLVPAFMQMAGSWNWWAPGPLRRLHDRFGWTEHDGSSAHGSAVPAASALPAHSPAVEARRSPELVPSPAAAS